MPSTLQLQKHFRWVITRFEWCPIKKHLTSTKNYLHQTVRSFKIQFIKYVIHPFLLCIFYGKLGVVSKKLMMVSTKDKKTVKYSHFYISDYKYYNKWHIQDQHSSWSIGWLSTLSLWPQSLFTTNCQYKHATVTSGFHMYHYLRKIVQFNWLIIQCMHEYKVQAVKLLCVNYCEKTLDSGDTSVSPIWPKWAKLCAQVH